LGANEKIIPPFYQSPLNFAYSVSISGNYVILGCVSEFPAGTAYIYNYNGSDWILQKKIITSDSQASFFGLSASISGFTAVVGAYAVNGYPGAAYVFRYDGTDWIESSKVKSAAVGNGDTFANALSVNGNYFIVGGILRDEVDGNLTGGAYIFQDSQSNWSEVKSFQANNSIAASSFGNSVQVVDKYAIIGANGTVYIVNIPPISGAIRYHMFASFNVLFFILLIIHL